MKIYPPLINILGEYKQNKTDATALIAKEIRITYKQLLEVVEHIAANLHSLLAPQQIVLLHLPNSLELVYAYLACFQLGVIATPISIGAKANELQIILNLTQATCILTHDNFSQELLAVDWQSSSIKQGFVVGKSLQSKALPFTAFENLLIANDLILPPPPNLHEKAALFFTSGSTGKSKGILHTHASLSAMAANIAYCGDVTETDALLVSEAMTNASGFTHVMAALSQGATAILLENFIDLIPTIRHDRATILFIIGKGNYDIINDPHISAEDFSSVRMNITGGDKITQGLLQNFKAKTQVPLRQSYGMSEILVITCNKSADENKLGSIGTVSKDVSIRLLDTQGNPVPLGKPGIAWVSGPNLLQEYWQDPRLTQQSIIKGWFCTEDLIYQDIDGYYWFYGRLKQIIIRQGDNISPFEVEEILAKHPAVKISGVIGKPDTLEGEVPVAFVVLKKNNYASPEELIQFAANYLEEYKVPVEIHLLQSLPLTQSNKIDRKKLKDDYLRTLSSKQ